VADDEEQGYRLPGGNGKGAVLLDGTVRRPARPWTPTAHVLLMHLEARGFDEVPRVVGMDELGPEVLTFLPGTTVECGGRGRYGYTLMTHSRT